MNHTRIAVAVLLAFGAGNAWAFHDGGVAECEGCHTMHNSEGGKPMTTLGGLTQYQAGPYLLQGTTQSEVCLNCHNSPAPGSYHVSTDGALLTTGMAPINYTPGGDFGWLKKAYAWAPRPGATATSPGERHGHNVIAPGYGYNADTTQTRSPGGAYNASDLQCTSCHDPHGMYRRFPDGSVSNNGAPIANSGSYNNSNRPVPGLTAVGVYRLLAGKNYQPKSVSGSVAFTTDPPAAVANSTYNKAESNNTLGQVRVAYGQGMSEWCSNCHGSMLQNGYTSGMKGLTHPAGNAAHLTAAVVASYGAYVSSGVITNVDPTRGYWTLAPVEVGSSDYDTATTGLKALAGSNALSAPDITANVMCLSCHRAHAGGFDSLMRFNTSYEMITGVAAGDATNTPVYNPSPAIGQGRTEAELTAAYYGRPANVFGVYQRDLCNKCHRKD